MKYFALALLLSALSALPAVSYAQCYTKAVKPGKTHCMDDTDKTWHAIGSSWRNSDCMDCDCGGCCSAYTTPVAYPHGCVSVFDKEACEYKVHKRDDPSVLCPILSAVGK